MTIFVEMEIKQVVSISKDVFGGMYTMQLSQARSIPCTGCHTPCCTFLPLYDFYITDHATLDYALYLIGFSNIEFALVGSNLWRVHYRMRCQNLDEKNQCIVHDTPLKPSVCRNYDPFQCFYVKAFGPKDDPGYVRFDRERFLCYVDALTFDDQRNIVSHPDMTHFLPSLPPFVEKNSDPVDLDFGSPRTNERVSADFFDNPCGDCSSYCCQSLSFPRGLVHTYAELDYLRFCLGFPGVELSVNSQMEWSVMIRTRCTQLNARNQCSLYGSDMRPQVCTLYDQNACAYRARFSSRAAPQELRVHMKDLIAIRNESSFLQSGENAQLPSFERIRALKER